MSEPPVVPIPVQTLHYSGGFYDRRPTMATVIGVFSIVLGCLSALASVSGVMMGFAFFMLSSMTIRIPPAPSPTTLPAGAITTTGDLPVLPDEDGLAPAKRAIVLAGAGHLSPAQRTQLGALLSQAGALIFPVAAGNVSLNRIRANISDSGAASDPDGGPVGRFLVTGAGRVEIYDDRATFQPGGSQQSVVVRAAPAFGLSAATGSNVKIAAPATMPVMPFRGMNRGTAVASIVENLISLGLAIFLFVLGILVLRGSRSALRRHWIYVALKLPLIALAAFASCTLMNGMYRGMGMPSGTTMPRTYIFIAWAIIGAAFAAAYPIALIFVLRSRGIRSYYRGENLAPTPPPFYPMA